MENNIKNHSQIMEAKIKSISRVTGILLGHICGISLSAALLMWGWNTIASHLNVPVFTTYWEAVIVRLALKSITNIFKK